MLSGTKVWQIYSIYTDCIHCRWHMIYIFKIVQCVILSSCRLGTASVGFLYKQPWNCTLSWSADTSWARRWASLAWKDEEDMDEEKRDYDTVGTNHDDRFPIGMALCNWNRLNMTWKWIIYSRQAVETKLMTEALVTASAERVPWFVVLVFIWTDTCGGKENFVSTVSPFFSWPW